MSDQLSRIRCPTTKDVGQRSHLFFAERFESIVLHEDYTKAEFLSMNDHLSNICSMWMRISNEIRLLNVSSCTVKSSANHLIDYDDSFMPLIIYKAFMRFFSEAIRLIGILNRIKVDLSRNTLKLFDVFAKATARYSRRPDSFRYAVWSLEWPTWKFLEGIRS